MADENDEAEALLAAIGSWPDDHLAAACAAARGRRRWLRQVAAESATMAGILLAVTERGEPVTIRCGPWSLAGRPRRVTTGLCILQLSGVELALLRTDAVTAVETTGSVVDDREPGAGPDLVAVLATLAPERPAVRLLLADATAVAGMLVGVGKDVASIRVTSAVASVRLSAIAGCILVARGSDLRSGTCQEVDSDGDFASLDDFGSG